MTQIAENLQQIAATIPAGVTLVAVSKLHPTTQLMEAYEARQRIFGESRVQELQQKQRELPSDIQWHFIGHLQTNKVKDMVSFVSLIHGVDSLRLLTEISKEAEKKGRVVNCLLQVHIASEETKFGFSADELQTILGSNAHLSLKGINICGLMGMASFTENEVQVRGEFRGLKRLFDELKASFFATQPSFNTLSMGMSGDYKLAIEEGSTMVRVGSAIFGERS